MQLALLQWCGLDVSDLFSTITSWPPPNFSPSSLCRACCWLGAVAWRSCLRTPLPLLPSPKSSGLLVTIIKIPREEGQVCMQQEEERLRSAANGAFASLCCALQLQASHSNSWASISSSFKWVCTIGLGGSWSPLHLDFDLPACLLWALLTPCHDNGWTNH